jgi:hypothetical protein
MGAGSQRLITAWIPIGDLRLDEGVLLCARGAHTHPSTTALYASYGQGKAGVDGTHSGWCAVSAADVPATAAASVSSSSSSMPSHSPSSSFTPTSAAAPLEWFGCQQYRAGDIVLLSLDCLHMTTRNVTNAYRLSADTRWQPDSDPRDDRIR